MRHKYDYAALPFAEETGTPAASGAGAGAAVPSGTPGEDAKPAEAEIEKTYSKKEVDAIKVRAKRDAEAKIRAEYEARAKAESEAAKLARMNDAEKARYELEQAKAELAALKHANEVAEMCGTVRKMGDAAGVAIPDDLAVMLVGKDAEETKTRADAFLRLLDGMVKKGVEGALNHKPPRAGTRSGNKATYADWAKETDEAKREQMIAENPDIFG